MGSWGEAMNGEGGNMFRLDSSRPADRDPVLMQGTAAAVNAPDGARASFRAADDAAPRSAAKSEAVKLDLYHLTWIFTVCCVLGLIGETAVSYFVDGRWEDRAGFLWGPFSPIYGVGVLIVTTLLEPVRENLALLFIGSTLLTSLLEWLTGFLLEKILHQKWWDYSNMPLNIGGYICLRFSLVWGITCMLVVRVVHPAVMKLLRLIPVSIGVPVEIGLIAVILVDFVVTFIGVLHLGSWTRRCMSSRMRWAKVWPATRSPQRRKTPGLQPR